MPESVTITCHACHEQNRVTPRLTVSLLVGGDMPIYDPLFCGSCRIFLRPTSDEWRTILQAVTLPGKPIPPYWWDKFARCNPPTQRSTSTA